MTLYQNRKPMTYEECTLCGSRTGNAGAGDGSLFIGEVGPLCEDCYDALNAKREN